MVLELEVVPFDQTPIPHKNVEILGGGTANTTGILISGGLRTEVRFTDIQGCKFGIHGEDAAVERAPSSRLMEPRNCQPPPPNPFVHH